MSASVPKRIERPRGRVAVERIDGALEDILARPGMGPGARLPTERALSEELGVARSAVRAALSRLEARGRVVRVMGSGTYVAEAPETPPPVEQAGGKDASPREIMETRLLIEPMLGPLIVAHANGADIERIRSAMLSAEAATDFAEFEVWDARFHQALADATQNRLMQEVYRTITTSRDLAEWGDLKRRSITEKRRRIYNREHAEIVAALQARDAARAEAAIRAHLVSVRENLLGT